VRVVWPPGGRQLGRRRHRHAAAHERDFPRGSCRNRPARHRRDVRRSLSHPQNARCRRDGRRLPGLGPDAGSGGCAQGDPPRRGHRSGGRARSRAALQARAAARPPGDPPQRRPHPRFRRDRRHQVHLDAVHRRARSGHGAGRGGPFAAAAGDRRHPSGGERSRGGARGGCRAPRSQAREHHGRRGRARADHGLRHLADGQHRRHHDWIDRGRRDRRHARVHGARAGARRSGGSARGRLRARPDLLRHARRPPPARTLDEPDGRDDGPPGGAAAPLADDGAGSAGAAGSDRFPRPGSGLREAIPERRGPDCGSRHVRERADAGAGAPPSRVHLGGRGAHRVPYRRDRGDGLVDPGLAARHDGSGAGSDFRPHRRFRKPHGRSAVHRLPGAGACDRT
jgi:hypothetical protein